MRRTLTAFLAVLLAASSVVAIQNSNSAPASTASTSRANSNKKRGPVFRASKEQIKQAQLILKQRGFYAGLETGKLDPDTREGLKRYQAAEQLKVTGTLNRVTLEKMNIQLTEKQRAM